GIGAAVAADLTAQGAAVVTVDLHPLPASSTASRAHVVADLTNADAVRRVVDEAVRRFGGLDILVSNVGIFPESRRIESIDDAAWTRTPDVNLTSHQRTLTAATPDL